MGVATPGAGITIDSGTDSTTDNEKPWAVILHDDPVNLVDYVTEAIVTICEVTRDKAEALMFEAHTNGKAAVWSGSYEKAEGIAGAFHTWGLNATLERA